MVYRCRVTVCRNCTHELASKLRLFGAACGWLVSVRGSRHACFNALHAPFSLYNRSNRGV